MALTVETGAGLADADSYISLVDAAAYHTARGNAAWAALASDTVREQLLRQATDYIENQYGLRFLGYRVSDTQALSWPRDWVPRQTSVTGSGYWPNDEVPAPVARACAELALRAATSALAPDITPPVLSEKVGPLEVTYAQGARQTTTFRAVDSLLAQFLPNVGMGAAKVVRA
jgi:hypothetical protein